MRDILDADIGAFMRLVRAEGMARYRKDVPRDVYHAVKIVGALAADCGPCAQLAVTMALCDGVPAAIVAQVVAGDDAALPEAVRLGVRFGRAVLAREAVADELRETLAERYGPRAIISLGFALVAAQMYPTLRYALGAGRACQRVVIDGQPVTPARVAA